MIHRQNWLDVKAYLHHLDVQVNRDPSTVQKYRKQLRHLLEWADATPLPQARQLVPSFPRYLVKARADGKALPLNYSTIYKGLITVRTFLHWARLEWPQRYRSVLPSWIALLQPVRESTPAPVLQDHRFYTLEEVQQLLAVSTETLHEERAQVAAATLFLTGMRPDTLASISVACMDLAHHRILQIPQLGVRTKNNKAAITYLLPIPDLRAVIDAWHQRVQGLGPDGLWYAPLNSTGTHLLKSTRAIEGRVSQVGDDLRLLCARAGVTYKSPHKLRHGHVVYARNLARNMEEFKAISQNVMHSSVLVTDQVYSDLTNHQVQSVISGLGSHTQPMPDLVAQLTALLDQLNRHPPAS